MQCMNCGHPLAGHMDTAGRMITREPEDHHTNYCHFDWYDDDPGKIGCMCPGFRLDLSHGWPIEALSAPMCEHELCGGIYTERHLCVCGNWFCDHCGNHINNDSYPDGHICWAGCA